MIKTTSIHEKRSQQIRTMGELPHLEKDYRWCQPSKGLTYDVLTLQWYETAAHSIETVLQNLNCDPLPG